MGENNPDILSAVLNHTSEAVIITDAANRIVRVNGAFERLTGYRAAEVVGKDPKILGSDGENGAISGRLSQALKDEGLWKGEVWTRRSNGDSILLKLTIFPASGECGAPDHFVALMSEPSARTEFHIDSTGTDPLTNLPNRYLFMDRLKQAMMTAKRAKKSVAALMVALDRFTLINEGLGHDSGDDLLKEVAKKLIACTRESDTVARFEGDLFVLIMPITTPGDVVIIAEKVLHSIKEPVFLNGHETVITSSIGISLFPDDSQTGEELVAHADSAMRFAKRSGGHQYQFFSGEMNAKAKKRLEMEYNLRHAVENGELLLNYQPKVNAETNEVRGMEALVRWGDASRGMIPPGIFIPIAEETGLIEEIGYWVLKTACAQTKLWQEKGLKPVRVSVNVSGRQFKERHLVEKVAGVLSETGLSPEYLEIELTESMLMDDIGEVVKKLKALRELGVYISIDDFGTGYSNLSYLLSFPITTLKIDRVFVHDIETNSNIAEISRTIINLSKGLNLEVIAEGAETKEHVDFLRALGCKMIQGYYYSEPLSAEEFEALLTGGLKTLRTATPD